MLLCLQVGKSLAAQLERLHWKCIEYSNNLLQFLGEKFCYNYSLSFLCIALFSLDKYLTKDICSNIKFHANMHKKKNQICIRERP